MQLQRTQEQTQTNQQKPQAQRVMTAPVQIAPETEAKYEKLLRQPRSRKFMKALKDADILTENDEALIERMKEVIEEETGEPVDDNYVFSTQEIDAFRQSVIETCEKSIANELEKEAQRIGELIEAEKKPVRLISPCAITGCVVHSFLPNGQIETHYTPLQVATQDEAFIRASEIVLADTKWTSVEIFTRKLVHRNERGDVIKIYNLFEE